jgi:hypothetical protein
VDGPNEGGEVRRQRSYPNLYEETQERRDSKEENKEKIGGINAVATSEHIEPVSHL